MSAVTPLTGKSAVSISGNLLFGMSGNTLVGSVPSVIFEALPKSVTNSLPSVPFVSALFLFVEVKSVIKSEIFSFFSWLYSELVITIISSSLLDDAKSGN